MKRQGNLWQRTISFYNLAKSADKAQRGKRFRADVARFHYNVERELWQLHDQLAAKTYHHLSARQASLKVLLIQLGRHETGRTGR
jgi:hypothetical protein